MRRVLPFPFASTVRALKHHSTLLSVFIAPEEIRALISLSQILQGYDTGGQTPQRERETQKRGLAYSARCFKSARDVSFAAVKTNGRASPLQTQERKAALSGGTDHKWQPHCGRQLSDVINQIPPRKTKMAAI